MSSEDNNLWQVLGSPKVFNKKVPQFIKNILAYASMDSVCVLVECYEELKFNFPFDEFTKLIKSSEYLELATASGKPEDYYGSYGTRPLEFRFNHGDRFLIKKILRIVNKYASVKNFWKIGTGTENSSTRSIIRTEDFDEVKENNLLKEKINICIFPADTELDKEKIEFKVELRGEDTIAKMKCPICKKNI